MSEYYEATINSDNADDTKCGMCGEAADHTGICKECEALEMKDMNE